MSCLAKCSFAKIRASSGPDWARTTSHMMSELEVLGCRYVFTRMRPDVSTIYAPVVWVQSDWMPKNA